MSLPFVVFGLPSGAIADNRDRRTVLLVAQGFLLVISGLLALLSANSPISPWTLLAFTFLVGCGNALNGPAWQASVGDMVPQSVLPSAIAYNALAINAARSVGPALGGVIVALAGSAAAFSVNAVCTVGLLAALSCWRPHRPPRRLPPERLSEAMVAGLRYTAMSPHLRASLVRTVLVSLAMSPLLALLPIVARDQLGGGPFIYGTLLGSFGGGAVASALLLKRLREGLTPAQMMQLTALLSAAGALGAAWIHSLWIMAPLLALAGAGWMMAFATLNVSIQLASPRWVTARALAIYQVAVYLGVAVGSGFAGMVAGGWGPSGSLSMAAALDLLLVVAGVLFPMADFNSENLAPSDAWRVPSTTVAIRMRSGPIAISIEHRIPECNVAAFLTVMQERRRLRLRDGASSWSLFRDLEDPALWIERYCTPTWLDYVRLNNRRTKSDEANFGALRDLYVVPGAPRIRRMVERSLGVLPNDADDDELFVARFDAPD